MSTKGSIYVGFTDIRDAKSAFEKVQRLHPEWRMRSLTAKEYAQKFDFPSVVSISDFEGQIFASVYCRNSGLDGRVVSHSFKDLVETFGDIKAFHSFLLVKRMSSTFLSNSLTLVQRRMLFSL